MLWCSCVGLTDNRRTQVSIPLSTISGQQQPQLPSTFQTWSSTSFYDDGHYSDIHSDVDVPAGISTWHGSFVDHSADYINYTEFYHQSVNEDIVEQRQTSSDNYQELDPSLLETLRQPPTPSLYDRLSPNWPNLASKFTTRNRTLWSRKITIVWVIHKRFAEK